jgi:hypothetical protein
MELMEVLHGALKENFRIVVCFDSFEVQVFVCSVGLLIRENV